MKYSELPKKFKAEARRLAVDAYNEICMLEWLPLVDENSIGVIQLCEDRIYEIEHIEYEPGVACDRLLIM